MTMTRTYNVVMLLVVLAALSYGALELTKHARTAHAGELWQADDIARYMDCQPSDQIHVKNMPNGLQAHWCQVNGDMGIGLIIAIGAGVIITGFMARLGYWRNCH